MSTSAVLRERQLVTMLVDLAGFTQSVAGLELHEVAELVDEFYRAAETILPEHGGRVVKLIGDGCVAVFEPDDALRALDAVDALRAEVRTLGARHNTRIDMGANIHMSTVAEGAFGRQGTYDVIGMGVIHTFRMGGGAGTRISEPVYRRLPSDRRSPWRKRQPPATYTREG
jgi:class 3 adenylate cyclase